MKILKVVKSERKDKKLKAILENGTALNFGSKLSKTYIEGATKQKRDNYMKRHLGNPIEKKLIQNNILSPALLSARLLWNTPSLEKNLYLLNKKL
jgi:hypothetical protein